MRSASPERGLTRAEQSHLVELAREAVARGLEGDRRWMPQLHALSPALLEQRASFVTLRRDDELLGCIGSIEPRRVLAHDVSSNARAAAFDDPRLPPVTHTEFVAMSVKVSVLGPLEPLGTTSFEQTEQSVEVGEGILVADERHRATFLPSVWQQVPDRDTFLAMLWQKAGLRPREWTRTLQVSRYTTLEFGD